MTTYTTQVDKNGKTLYYHVTDGKKKNVTRAEYEANQPQEIEQGTLLGAEADSRIIHAENEQFAAEISVTVIESESADVEPVRGTAVYETVKSIVADTATHKMNLQENKKSAPIMYRNCLADGTAASTLPTITTATPIQTLLKVLINAGTASGEISLTKISLGVLYITSALSRPLFQKSKSQRGAVFALLVELSAKRSERAILPVARPPRLPPVAASVKRRKNLRETPPDACNSGFGAASGCCRFPRNSLFQSAVPSGYCTR